MTPAEGAVVDISSREVEVSAIGSVVADLRGGGLSVVLDGVRGAVLVMAAATATPHLLHFAVRHSSGLVHAAMRPHSLERLRIPGQPVFPSENNGSGFMVAVDAVDVGTGISGKDRATTLRTLAAPGSTPDDLRRPGHVLPVLCPVPSATDRLTVWQAALELLERAGVAPVAAVCRLVHDSGDVLDDEAGRRFAARYDLAVVCIDDVAARMPDTRLTA